MDGDTLLTSQSVIPMPLTKSISNRLERVPDDAVAGAKRERRKEARPQELLDAALALFVEKGFVATRSEEVAARAGVSKGTLYLYYPSKEELLKAVIRQQLSSQIAAGALEVERYVGPTSTLLVEVLSRWWQ